MLKSIELIGFKSFAKKSKLEFDSSVTAIVGPNGSGKSNTAEAFRFVLGEQGGKILRVKKGTDLIWAGTKSLARASRAGVRLVLDNSAGRLNIDFGEVVVERSVLLDGSHEYFINGSKVRLKDVQDLLAGANIGSSGHHIISQGQADRILAATPKERREMLEDALGLKSYMLRKAEAERKLLATEENLSEIKSTKREMLPQLKYLKKQAEAVERARALRQELECKFAVYVIKERERLSIISTKALQDLESPKLELSDTERNIQKLRAKLSTIIDAPGDAEAERELKELERELEKKRSDIASLKHKLGKTLGQIELLSSMARRESKKPETVPREAVRAVLLRIRETLQQLKDTKGKTSSKSSADDALKEINRFIKDVLDAGETTTSNGSAYELEELSKTKAKLEIQISEKQKEITVAETELNKLQDKKREEDKDTMELERDIYKETARYNELAAQVADIENTLTQTRAQEERLQEDIREMEALLGKHMGQVAVHNSGDVPDRLEIERLKLQVESAAGIDTGVVEEYGELRERYEYLESQTQDLAEAESKLRQLMTSLDKRAKQRFDDGLGKVNMQFDEFFSILFGGGGAKLEIDKGDDENKPGVRVSVQLPRKRVTTLETLSGGERALASIALIFAMSQVNPPPFLILDETDAALDEANSRRYAEVVRRLSGKSQVILITHNRATMAVADTLYGVTMGGDGVSQLLSVRLSEAERYAK